jgi:hypothetical protein
LQRTALRVDAEPERHAEVVMKTLGMILSLVGLGLVPGVTLACQTDFPNQVILSSGDLIITFATDRAVYDVGEPVDFFLCIENRGTAPFSFHTWAIPQNGCWVLSDTCTTPASDYCFNLGPYVFPEGFYWMERTLVIPPGASQTWTHQWGGRKRSGELPSPGVYPVFGGLRDDRGNGEEMLVPPGGVRLTITLSSGVPTLPTTWGQVKALYNE